MKSRLGFVSNSSSCSFFVSLKEFPTTIDLAGFMIETRHENTVKSCLEEIERIRKHPADNSRLSPAERERIEQEEIADSQTRRDLLKRNLEIIAKAAERSPNLAFKSCNFDTFIREVEIEGKKYFYVATCNNTRWDLPKVTPEGRIPNPDNFTWGDLYDGAWDSWFIDGEDFTVIDDNQKIYVKSHFVGINRG